MLFLVMKYLLLLLALSACAQAPIAKTDHTAPRPNLPSVNYTVHATSTEELDRMAPVFSEGSPDSIAVYFSSYEEMSTRDAYNFTPAIVVKRKDAATQLVILPDFKKYGWVFAAALPAKGMYWGFLDYQVEGAAQVVTVIASDDGAKTWHALSSIPKANFEQEMDYFAVDENGQGFAILKQDEASIVYDTADFGKTWSAPRTFPSNAARPAEDRTCFHNMYSGPRLKAECRLPKEVRRL